VARLIDAVLRRIQHCVCWVCSRFRSTMTNAYRQGSMEFGRFDKADSNPHQGFGVAVAASLSADGAAILISVPPSFSYSSTPMAPATS
jgi:hypothetical protein